MGTKKTKSYPIRMSETVMDRVRESAALANLKQGDFICNLIAMYELRLQHAYQAAEIDLVDRCEELDTSFMRMLLIADTEGKEFSRDKCRDSDSDSDEGIFHNRPNDNRLGEMAWNIGHNFKIRKSAVWEKPEIILPPEDEPK